MKKLIAFFLSIITSIFGRISWEAPPWALFFDGIRKNRPRTYYSALIVILCLAAGGTAGYQYFKTLPKPNLIIAKAALDEIKPPSEDKTPAEPLFISFSRQRPEGETPEVSAARLDLAGRKLTSGITIRPGIEGTWEWENDLKIKFSPKAPWPAAQTYTAVISPEILEKKIRLKDDEVNFQTAPFKASFEEGPSLYTDPRNRSVHQASATIVFTHFIDEKSLKDGIALSIAAKNGSDTPVNYSVTLDKTGRRAHILSDPIKIGSHEQFLRVAVKERIRTTQGGAGLSGTLTGKLQIPAVSTFFHVNKMDAVIIPNLKKEPEQTLTVYFSDTVRRKVLEGKINAWLLPPKDQARPYESWTSPSQINKEILGRSSELPLNLAEIMGESSDQYGLVFDAPENRQIYVKIASGITSESGFELAKPYDAVFPAPIYPKEARILGHGGIIASSGSKTLSIQTRGLSAVKISIRRLLPQQLQHLVSQTGGDITSPDFNCSYSFTEANISEPFEKIIPLSPKDPKSPVYVRLNFSEFLDPEMQKPGVFFVEINGWDPKTREKIEIPYAQESGNPEQPNKRTIIITDLAILIKNATDKGRDIFVESVGTGSPAGDAEVLIIAKNGETLQSGKTGEGGHVAFPPLGEAVDAGREPSFCMVKKGADLTFLPFDRQQRQMDMSKFDIGGVETRYMDKNQLNAFAFSDRGIYRPGEMAHLGFLVRSKGFAIPAGIPLELQISDPRSSMVVKKNLTLPESGFFDVDFPTTAASATGEHRAEIFLVSKKGYADQMIGSVTFKVEEFEPQRMRISSTLSETAPGWALPGNLTAAVTLKNLFGVPAQNRKVTGKITLQPAGFHFDKYPEVVFTDPLLDKENPLKQITREIEAHQTGKDGQVLINLDLGKFEKGTYRLNLMIEGFDEAGGKSVRTSNTVLVSPMQAIVGYKADGDLSFIRQGSERKMTFIAVNRELGAEALEKLILRKQKIMTVSALVKQDNGTYAYQSAKKEETLWEKPFDIPEKGRDMTVETGEAGNYALEIRDESGKTVCRAPYSVAGESNITAEIEKTAELSIKLSQTNVKAGGDLEFQITTPYRGAGLITIETDRVYGFKWFKAENLTSIQTIKIPEVLEGNAYVCVTLVRSMDDPDIFTSPLSYAVASFAIDRAKRTLVPEIRVPDTVIPGTQMDISFKAPRPCKIVVFAVDEGILQFAGYKTPAPLDHFLKKTALEVTTFQTADLILPEYNLLVQRMGTGGDADAAALRARHLNPFARKNNKPAVFWSGIMDAGPEERTVSWITPDTFNGEVRVMALAADPEGMGTARASAIVRGPFVVNPVLPLAVTPGDAFTMAVGVANAHKGSGKKFPVTLTIDSGKSFAVLGDAVKKIAVDEDGENTAVFNVKTIGAPGEASIRFHAASGDVKASTSASLSIRPATPLMTTLMSGISDSGNAKLSIGRKIIPEFSSQKISVSASPLVLAQGLETWLNEFPYGCTEQLLSRGFPALAYAAYPGGSYTKEIAAEKVRGAVAMLRERQTADGGFAMWPGGPASDFASIYGIHFLTDAVQAGFQTPRDMLDKGIAYLRTKAGEEAEGKDARLRAYSIYLLTRNEMVTSNYLIDLEKDIAKDKIWKQEITASFMAASYRMMKQDKLAWALFGKFKPPVQIEYDDLFLGSDAAQGLDMYLTARHFPEALKRIGLEKVEKMISPVLNGSFDTFEAAWTIMALSAWAKDEPLDAISISELSDKGEARPLKLTFDPFPTAEFGASAAGLDLKAGRRVFYIISQSGFDRDMPKTEIKDGLEIIREFKPAPEKRNAAFRPGDDITAVLKIRALDGRQVNNVALTDMFAGCFSPDIPSVRENSGNNSIDYIDVREDRAVFYGSFGNNITELSYKLRVTAAGEFVAPPAFAESLYDNRIKARSLPGAVKVEN